MTDQAAIKHITEPGVYDLGEAVYHADPCPEPSLSASIAVKLIARSPRHAWHSHPRLNPDYEPEEKPIFDRGKAPHALLLEGDARVKVIYAQDWKTKAAKEARDAARAAGRIPLLEKHWADVQAMMVEARQQLAYHSESRTALIDGNPELTLVWREGPIWCRARLDWLPNEGETLWDLKTTGGSAEPDAWIRTNLFPRAAIQAAFYMRGTRAVLGWKEPEFRFVVQENQAPYQLSIIALAPSALALAEAQVKAAIEMWSICTARGEWPGYPPHIAWAEAPSYVEWAWGERKAREQVLEDSGEDPFGLKPLETT